MQRAFTLIELLIVVAIIAILAAIAVPNFLEAQTRARVGRVMADHRAMVTALETYHVDHGRYVPSGGEIPGARFERDSFVRYRFRDLTTPIAYLTTIPTTPFWARHYKHSEGFLEMPANLGSEYAKATGWYNNQGPILAGAKYNVTIFHLRDPGPDHTWNNQDLFGNLRQTNLMPYDPTNGTVSQGDIWRFGP